MSKLGKLFGAKSKKNLDADKETPKPEDITIMMQSPISANGESAPTEGFGLQFTLESGEIKSFESLPIMIGRGESNEINLTDDSVSTRHARIYFDDRVGSVCIEDSHSLNGVYINDLPTSKNILRDGDKIRAGNVVLIFRDTGFIYQGTQEIIV